jgi:hypothetical protein
MAFVPITDPQLKEFKRLARKAGVGNDEFQAARNNGKLQRAIEILKPGLDVSQIVAPPGARIHVFRDVRVTLDSEWQEAVNAAGPNTPSDYNVRKVGDLYLPTGTGEIVEDLVGLNYPDGSGNWEKALAWAAISKLEKTVPREAFAVGRQFPQLNDELGINPMYAVATTECSFEGDRQACYVWWLDSKREAFLLWTGFFFGRNDWFLFRKTDLKTKKL